MMTISLRLITTSQPFLSNCQLAMGIQVPDGRLVAPGAIFTSQSAAVSLPLAPYRCQANGSRLSDRPRLSLVKHPCKLEMTINHQIAP